MADTAGILSRQDLPPPSGAVFFAPVGLLELPEGRPRFVRDASYLLSAGVLLLSATVYSDGHLAEAHTTTRFNGVQRKDHYTNNRFFDLRGRSLAELPPAATFERNTKGQLAFSMPCSDNAHAAIELTDVGNGAGVFQEHRIPLGRLRRKLHYLDFCHCDPLWRPRPEDAEDTDALVAESMPRYSYGRQ
jgi:hypothetical protein